MAEWEPFLKSARDFATTLPQKINIETADKFAQFILENPEESAAIVSFTAALIFAGAGIARIAADERKNK